MASKTISVTEEVYTQLSRMKEENESFSELFTRLMEMYHTNLIKCFGTWKLSKGENEEIWEELPNRLGRKWNHPSFGENA